MKPTARRARRHCALCCKAMRELLAQGMKIKRGWSFDDAVDELHDPRPRKRSKGGK